jgi:hypothetical protein
MLSSGLTLCIPEVDGSNGVCPRTVCVVELFLTDIPFLLKATTTKKVLSPSDKCRDYELSPVGCLLGLGSSVNNRNLEVILFPFSCHTWRWGGRSCFGHRFHEVF